VSVVLRDRDDDGHVHEGLLVNLMRSRARWDRRVRPVAPVPFVTIEDIAIVDRPPSPY